MSDLTEFLLARIAEDEAWGAEHPHFGDGTAPDDYVPPWWTRVRAECEARRRIVERYVGKGRHQWSYKRGQHDMIVDVLADLAVVYADHPDYREQWRP